MSLISENPVLFVKHTCPFCLKVRLYLLEAGLLDGVTLRESRTPEEEDAMKAELVPHVAKVSYPTLRLGDSYITESDDIIAHFVSEGGPSPSQLPTFEAYVDGPFAQLLALHKENAELKRA